MWALQLFAAFQTHSLLFSFCSKQAKRVIASAVAETGDKGPGTYVRSLLDESSFLAATSARPDSDELVVIKFYAPWCRACRGLEPKYRRLAMEYSTKRVVFYEMSHNSITGGDVAFLQKLDVNVLPLVQFYASGKRVEAFPCGPRKIELLREKLEKWQDWRSRHKISKNERDLSSRDLHEIIPKKTARHSAASVARGKIFQAQVKHEVLSTETSGSSIVADARIIAAGNIMARAPLMAQLNEAQLGTILADSRIAAYEAGDILISEGDIGRRFFVLLDGECDVFQLSNLASPSRMPGFSPDPTRTTLGGRTNTLIAGSYFGERALVTNEPRAASIVAATSVLALIADRSALATADRQMWSEDVAFESLTELLESSAEGVLWGYEQTTPIFKLVRGCKKNISPRAGSEYFENRTTPLPVMQRLRLLRSVVRAFDQAAARAPKWGDAAEISYRKGLVAQLTSYQRQELKQTFALLDRDGDGSISVTDLAALMIAVGRRPDAVELASMINKANPEIEGNTNLRLDDFLALMAQAEFSAMFLEAFKLLDPESHGWVESELLWQMMNALIPSSDLENEGALFPGTFGGKLDKLVDTFGVSDGHIDYQAFVKIMMSQS